MPPTVESLELIHRRHPEWREHQLRWRWLLDSLEGGERYRQAVYGHDLRGLPIRNLIRHKREYPDPRESGAMFSGLSYFGPDDFSTGQDPAASATDDDYELRRARTPVPTFVAEAIDTHLSRIYAREVTRVGDDRLMAWWSDVDGCGTTIDQWMAETVAPLLLTLGQLDLAFDHPAMPEGAEIHTRADAERLGLDRCVASYILPENMLWWRLDPTGHNYAECLVREYHEEVDGTNERYRYWTDDESTFYDPDGTVISVTPHSFGRVPIVRVFDRRKPRCKNVGQPRYEGVAERQREYYNRDSELILSDTTQAHPLLQGPEDFVQADGTIPIGPSWLLPKKKNTQGGATTYEGFDVVDFPKDGAESIRKNKADLRDDVDRDSALVSPTGRVGMAQSGLSKAFDHAECNNRLAKIAKILGRAEELIAGLALTVLDDGRGDTGSILVIYPTEFDLFTATDMATATASFQQLVAGAGALPFIEGLMLTKLMRLCLPGLGDAEYAQGDTELSAYLLGEHRDRESLPVRPDASAP
jgi:Phage portal protein, SPP1 Gp6-like